jgi:hypothetical protein
VTHEFPEKGLEEQRAPEGTSAQVFAATEWHSPLGPARLLALQRSIGNRALGHLLARPSPDGRTEPTAEQATARPAAVRPGVEATRVRRVLARQALVSGSRAAEVDDDSGAHSKRIVVNGETVLVLDLPAGTDIELKQDYQEGQIPSFSVIWIWITLPEHGTALLKKDTYQATMNAAADRWSIQVDRPEAADLEGHVPAHTWSQEEHSDPPPPPNPKWAKLPRPPVQVLHKPKPPPVQQAAPAGPPPRSAALETVLAHMREQRWDTDDLAAKLSDGDLAGLSPQERVDLIQEIGGGYIVDDEDETTIDRLIELTPTSDYADVARLMVARPRLLKTLDDAIDGDEYKRYIAALTKLLAGARDEKDLYTAIDAAPVLAWTGSGFTREKATYDVTWLDNGNVRIRRWYGLTGLQMEATPLELAPDSFVQVRFVYDDPSVGAKAGEFRPMPVASFIGLVNTKFRQDMWLGIQVAFVVGSAGSLGTVTGLARLLAILDVAVGAANIAIDSYRAQIAATANGQAFLKGWDTLQYLLAAYGLVRIAMHVPQAIRGARNLFAAAQGEILEHGSYAAANDVDAKLGKLESAFADVEQEAKAHPPGEGGSIPEGGGSEPTPTPPLPKPPTRVRLMHGTDQAGFEGVGGLGAGKIDVAHAAGAHQDFGRGFYLTTDAATAEAYGLTRNVQRSGGAGGGMTHVLAYDVALEDLGTVVDIRRGGNFRTQWEAFLAEPPFRLPAGLDPPAGMETRAAYLRGIGAEQRGRVFEEFLKRIGMSEADAIVGPLGDDVFTGITAGQGETTQVCVRSQRAADKLNAIAAGPPGAH